MTDPTPLLSDARMLSREHLRDERGFWTAESDGGMVATAHWRATAAGREILRCGGNAVDAALAASFALGVCEPAGSGLGGMVMMLVHDRERGTIVLEGPCRAPLRATPENVLADRRKSGYRAVAVPTFIAVAAAALERFGSLSLDTLLAPAIEMAEEGVPVSALQQRIAERYIRPLSRENGSAFFLDADRRPFPLGTLHRQPVLAATLRRLAGKGLLDFYQGEIARRIVCDMERNGGFIRADDLADVPFPRGLEPLRGVVGGKELLTTPPPGGGVELLYLLGLHEHLSSEARRLDTPAGVGAVAELIRRVRSDRRRFFRGESGFERMTEFLDPARLRDAAGEVPGSGETTHLSVVDRHGNAVSMTQSIERCFGAKVVTADLGFPYNGYLRTFKVERRDHRHFLRPGAPARSNAAPTMLFSGGAPVVVVGSTGSETVASGLFEVLTRLEHGDPFDAVRAARWHATPEGEVLAEEARLPEGSRDALEARGFKVRALEPWSFKLGAVQMVVRDGRRLVGVADPRRDGAAAGIP